MKFSNMANVRCPPGYPLPRSQLVRDNNHRLIKLPFRRIQTVLPCERPQILQNIEYPVPCHSVLFPIG